ncbi:TatD family hydrolase [Nesterenkonia aerolata]|uniref:TatD family hydrolase n=1 Tax=Nesterenkonia aerolata TaxID=3074079 RepID=A0ABU2DUI9_9MICC|nr:TatD family hydrolase [Nesterenkonia sp. LY-0111]MDR8020154.1 TatD family hydrolase [Nesterenkonia sp. LY-0111]
MESQRPLIVTGQTPAPYVPCPSPEAAEAAEGGEFDGGGAEGPVRDSREEHSRRKRRLEYPPAPEPLPVPMIDNHAHLDFRDGMLTVEVAEALAVAQAVGVSGVIGVGYDVASSEFSVRAAQEHRGMKAAVALHPNEAPQLVERGEFEDAFARIVELSGEDQVVAVGESGMDRFRTGEEGIAAQRQSFARHIELAVERSLALQIHDRDAHDDVVAVLREAPRLPESVVFHCFSGDAELARICNDNGWYMSFAGTVTFNNAAGLREALAIADPQLILVETDTPFLTPHPYRGRPNAPYLIPQTLRFMAEHRETTVESLGQQVMYNTVQAYGAWT